MRYLTLLQCLHFASLEFDVLLFSKTQVCVGCSVYSFILCLLLLIVFSVVIREILSGFTDMIGILDSVGSAILIGDI